MIRARTVRTAVTAAAAMLLTTMVMAGCGGDEASPAPTTPGTATRDPNAPKAAPLPVPPNLGTKVQGVAKDVKITECPTQKGKVVATGTATNAASGVRDIAVIVIWLKKDSGDPLGSGLATVTKVGAGKTVNWKVNATLVDQADRCALNATSGTLTGSATKKPAATTRA